MASHRDPAHNADPFSRTSSIYMGVSDQHRQDHTPGSAPANNLLDMWFWVWFSTVRDNRTDLHASLTDSQERPLSLL
jgi:hypothetical protein